MPDVADFAAAITSLKTAFELAKTLIDARDAGVIRSKVIELQREILSAQSGTLAAQSAQLALLDRVRDLEGEVTDLKAWDADKEKYQLVDVGIPGPKQVFAYALKEEGGSSKPKHLICAQCYQDRRKSVLQQEQRSPDRTMNILVCPRCGTEINRTGISAFFPGTKPSRQGR